MSKKSNYKRSEKEVAEYKKLAVEYIAFYENSTDYIYIINKDNCVLSVNQQGSKLLNKEPEDVIGKSIFELFSDKISKKYFNSIKTVFETGDPTIYEHEIISNNTTFWLNTNLSPVKGNDGEVFAVMGVSRDITTRKMAEEELRASEERYRSFVQNFQGIAFRGRMDFSPIFFHGAVEEITGYTERELTEGSLRWDQVIHPEDLPALFTEKEKGLHSIPNYSYERDYRIVHKDGAIKWIHEIIQNICDDSGKPALLQGAIYDITERKRSEMIQTIIYRISEESRTSGSLETIFEKIHNELNNVMDVKNFYVALYDVDTNKYNFPYHVDEYDLSDDFSSLEYISLEKSITDYVRRTGKAMIITEDIEIELRKNEEIMVVGEPCRIWMGAPLKGRKDNVIGIIGLQNYEDEKAYDEKSLKLLELVANNIGELIEKKKAEEVQQKLEEQLIQAQKLEGIGQLAGGIAHDLNNILTAIIGYTELALKGLEKGKNIRDNLDQVMLSGSKASELITKILAFSRKQIIVPEVMEVNSTILNLSKILHRLISEDIKIAMNLQANISSIKADPTQIEQVLINLVVNARDAIKQKKKPENGKVISVETKEVFLDKEYVSSHVDSTVGQHVLISVTDNGLGIDKKIIDRIFEPFFTTKELGRGTGLGLSTVYGIVKQNNGSIYVYSVPGRGTTVKIYWPAFIDETPLKEEFRGEKSKGGSETILFVEDDHKVRKASEQLLALFGYKVFSALNGRLAFDLVKNKNIKIDILVTDVVMPEMGGIELSEKLNEIYPGIKVLYCSGYLDNPIISANGILDENINFIAKPYSSKKLAKKIREILDKK